MFYLIRKVLLLFVEQYKERQTEMQSQIADTVSNERIKLLETVNTYKCELDTLRSERIAVTEEQSKKDNQDKDLKLVENEKKDLENHIADLHTLNSSLHDQIEVLITKLSTLTQPQTNTSLGSIRLGFVSANESAMETSKKDTIDNSHNYHQLLDTIKVLRKEKDITNAQLDIYTALEENVKKMNERNKALEDELAPLNEQVSELTAKLNEITSENLSLRTEAIKWRQRANGLVEKSNKNPEEFKRLQLERDNLAKMLTTEKDISKKLNDELTSLRAEKSRLEQEIQTLQRQLQQANDEKKKANDDFISQKQLNAGIMAKVKDVENKLLQKEETCQKLTKDNKNKQKEIRKITKCCNSRIRQHKKTIERMQRELIDQKNANKGVTFPPLIGENEQLNPQLGGLQQSAKPSNSFVATNTNCISAPTTSIFGMMSSDQTTLENNSAANNAFGCAAPVVFGNFGTPAVTTTATSTTNSGTSQSAATLFAFGFAPQTQNISGGLNFGTTSESLRPAFNFAATNQPALNFTGTSTENTQSSTQLFQFVAPAAPSFNDPAAPIFGSAPPTKTTSNTPFQFNAGTASATRNGNVTVTVFERMQRKQSNPQLGGLQQSAKPSNSSVATNKSCISESWETIMFKSRFKSRFFGHGPFSLGQNNDNHQSRKNRKAEIRDGNRLFGLQKPNHEPN